jgi:GR25 family glycosyltransferase involved in LPS biosynthesis
MKSYVITIKGMDVSELGFAKCKESSATVKNTFELNRFDAIVPEGVDSLLAEYNIKWNYPWQGQEIDFSTGLVKSAYVTARPKARIAAALSHYSLWKKAIEEPIMVLEHDAYFTARFDLDISKSKGDIIGINNPLGCTRRSREFYQKIVENQSMYQPAPTIDEFNIPQGIAGNSAYIIKPAGAKKMLELVDEHGLWPNDAIMCRQLVPNLMVTRKFFTSIQNLRSTTTL